MENNDPDYRNINGWGIDADPRNEPTYPMKKYTGDDHNRLNYERPPLQPVDVEILHSNERPNVSAVFGTSNPPKGLSGAIRRFAFRYSENQYRHWLPLLLADRVNVFEGVIDDISKGHIPNFFAESGWNAEWKYNKKGLIAKVITRVAIITAVIAIVRYRKKEKKLW
jgi:hypothetical protein